MPYKFTDKWHEKTRIFLKEKFEYLDEETFGGYRRILEAAGALLEWRDPLSIRLPDMKALETRFPGVESTRAHWCIVTKVFLSWCENRDARKWKIAPKIRAKVDGVFFSESETALIRGDARKMGPDYELIFSLGADNGLRCVDMLRLTTEKARELLRTLSGQILGKGQAGGKTGHLELSKMTVRPLTEYLQWRDAHVKKVGQDHPQLFVRFTKKKIIPLQWAAMRKRMLDLSMRVGLTFRLHDLRRTYGHRLHKAGVPIETIAMLMRHATINQSFKSYIGIQSDEMRRAQDLLGMSETAP